MIQIIKNHDLVNRFKSLRSTCQKYEQTASKLNVDTEIFDKKLIRKIISESEQLEEQINETQKESRKLSIGIIGQVKAGKSSFLNSLVFEGKDILPKAAAPMTAALTI
ncbi:MAG TPA: dynamin family protein, partial [Candidatus Cloacimonadota bacterium]|nr:dynamin family protein [Candidatus Cloacimonadota bacterium]